MFNKDDVNEYHSQPAPKPSSWILKKWRSKDHDSGSSSSNNENPPSNPLPNQQRKRNWAIPDDESHNWSRDVVEFYNHGDAQFCYSGAFFRQVQLDKRFWGTLLGKMNNGHLTVTHIKGWVGRLMNCRRRELQTNVLAKMSWTILPPHFYDLMFDYSSTNLVSYANGKLNQFPKFFDVDHVFLPFCLRNQEWLLVRIDLRSQQLLWYCTKTFDNEIYTELIHPKLVHIGVYFGALLVNISFWKKLVNQKDTCGLK